MPEPIHGHSTGVNEPGPGRADDPASAFMQSLADRAHAAPADPALAAIVALRNERLIPVLGDDPQDAPHA
jgi:hypothetical protein